MSSHLEHGLLVLAVLHLGGGQVQHAPLYWVAVAVVDEHVRATHHHKVLHPRVGAGLHEAQEALLRHHRPGVRSPGAGHQGQVTRSRSDEFSLTSMK